MLHFFVVVLLPLTLAEYELLTAGVSCSGTMDLQWMAWHWENRYGWVLAAVCSGGSHCRALELGLVVYVSVTFRLYRKK